MQGRNYLDLNAATMTKIVQLWLNDRWLSRSGDVVPCVTAIEHLHDATGSLGPNVGRYRITLEEPLHNTSGLQASAQPSPPNRPQQAVSAMPYPSKSTP